MFIPDLCSFMIRRLVFVQCLLGRSCFSTNFTLVDKEVGEVLGLHMVPDIGLGPVTEVATKSAVVAALAISPDVLHEVFRPRNTCKYFTFCSRRPIQRCVLMYTKRP